MRLPNTAHTSRPWRIHELTADFRLEDVWALPTPGGPDDFPRLVQRLASGDLSQGSSRAARTLWAIRWKVGELLGWDDPDAGDGLGPADAPRPVAVGSARRSIRPGLRRAPLHLALPDRRRVGRGGRQPDRSRGDAHRLGPGPDGRLPRPDGRSGEAKRPARDRLHGRDQAVSAPDRVPANDARDRAGLAGARFALTAGSTCEKSSGAPTGAPLPAATTLAARRADRTNARPTPALSWRTRARAPTRELARCCSRCRRPSAIPRRPYVDKWSGTCPCPGLARRLPGARA